MCWAYYPYGENASREKPEPLDVHLLDVANYMLNHSLTVHVVNKVSRLLSIPNENIRDIVYLIGLLHDIGKASHRYQVKPGNGFSGHEYLSAYGVNAFFAKRKNGSMDILKRLLIQPIILHHYAQKTDVEKSSGSSKDLLDNKDGHFCIKLWDPCKPMLEHAFTEGMKQLRTEFAKELLSLLLNSVKHGLLPAVPEDFISGLKTITFDGRTASVMALTGLLNEADGVIAKRNRNEVTQ